MTQSQLIPIGSSQISGQFIPTANARDIHDFLGVKRDFSNWIKQRISYYGFKKNADYVVFAKVGENPEGGRRRRSTTAPST